MRRRDRLVAALASFATLAALPAPARAQSPCQPTVAAVRAFATGARQPRLVAGRSSLLLAYEVGSGDQTRSVVRRLPIATWRSDPGAVLHDEPAPARRDSVDDGRWRAELLRVGGHPALLRWVTSTPSRTPSFEARLVVPDRPSDDARLRLPYAVYRPALFGAAGGTLFLQLERDEEHLLGYAFRGGAVRRGILSGAGPPGSLLPVRLVAVSETEAVVVACVDMRCEAPAYRIIDSGSRLAARPLTEPVALPPVVVGHRAGSSRDPRIRVLRSDGRRTAILGFGDDAARFSPSVIELGGRRWLVYSRGLGRHTRVLAREIDAALARVSEPAIRLSSDDREAGRVAADAAGGRAFAAWTEREGRRTRLRLAELVCRASEP